MRAQESDSAYLLGLRDGLHRIPVVDVPLRDLRVESSPRSRVETPEHTRTLAEAGEDLPPVLVHRASMTVIDGIHRLRAAQVRGAASIAVRYFDGSAEDGLLLAVAVNGTHGLPLSVSERTAAVKRIVTAHPEWSDRSVAKLAGLSPAKTAEIRRTQCGDVPPGVARVGRDGRVRPLDSARRRERAAELLRESPEASLRQIAKKAGISPATVADVRDRIARGDPPVAPVRGPRTAVTTSGAAPVPAEAAPVDPVEICSLLRRDPSLRLSEAGRAILRLLDAGAVVARNREDIAAGLPSHCRASVARLAQVYAESWQLFAAELQPADARPTGSRFRRGDEPVRGARAS
ncbi:ParB N-terminal domain-containing protein [Streptomyces sp. NPDC005761]|uniref:ParB N-terminal domain-containing protein n=1 Tax=Streptomyces sp. NPDC005761 TaxID=3157066 RepID=UPI0033CEAEF6